MVFNCIHKHFVTIYFDKENFWPEQKLHTTKPQKIQNIPLLFQSVQVKSCLLRGSTMTIIFDLSSINLAQIVHFIYIYRLWPGLWFATIVDPKASLPPELETKKYDMRFKFYIAKHLFNENIPSIRPLCPVLRKIKP